MRRLYFATLISFFYACNSSPEKISQESISEYLKKNLNDPSSYSSMNFGKLTADSSSMSSDPQYDLYEDSLDEVKSKREDLTHKLTVNTISLSNYSIESRILGDSSLNIMTRQLAWMNSYKGRPVGFRMVHTFRRKNNSGAIIIDSLAFKLDSSYKIKQQDYYKRINDNLGASRYDKD